ncbi:hypothetical protein F5H01DRAFT_129341 [Linnemannia elongata]|nr:hypothetical protein F5H01DRAFT_129341 [Linnemannia elongata]
MAAERTFHSLPLFSLPLEIVFAIPSLILSWVHLLSFCLYSSQHPPLSSSASPSFPPFPPPHLPFPLAVALLAPTSRSRFFCLSSFALRSPSLRLFFTLPPLELAKYPCN